MGDYEYHNLSLSLSLSHIHVVHQDEMPPLFHQMSFCDTYILLAWSVFFLMVFSLARMPFAFFLFSLSLSLSHTHTHTHTHTVALFSLSLSPRRILSLAHSLSL